MSIKKTGVLLVNLGTPAAPTPEALKRYLSEFLLDKRVIDTPKWLWYPLLKGVILPRRVPKVVELYKAIWTESGSPLMAYSLQQKEELNKCLSDDIMVELAMTYGEPSIDTALDNLQKEGVKRIIVLPLYPQYSCTTTAAVWDALARALSHRRDVPDISFIRDYATEPYYINALADSVERSIEKYGKPDLLLFSYHGIPKRYGDEGDDYELRCKETTLALVHKLGLTEQQYRICFQSQFGKEEWLKPYTADMLAELPKTGIKRIHVICPGFAADCLETLEEIAVENKARFLSAGGVYYRYIPALNADPLHIKLLQRLVLKRLCDGELS